MRQTSLRHAARTPTRDSFLDAVKAIAIVRVLAWHTWSWWWLSWFAAMPAMFFVSGALLDGSVERRGATAVIRSRLRRLLPPFWVYSACAVTVMLLVGWRPSLREAAAWVLPLGDPVGSAETPGLWIPLWYLRAYLWVLLAAPLLAWTTRRLGVGVLALPAAATFGLWVAQRNGATAPIAVTDLATFSFFVLAGMLYHRRAHVRTAVAATVGVVATAGAVAWWAGFGPSSGVVNESYPLQLLAGCGVLGFLVASAAPLANVSGRTERAVRYIGSRALTIYLWQGFGLLAADQLVTRQHVDGVAGVVLSGVVVAVVTGACVAAFGWVEDLAAGRPARVPQMRVLPLAAAGTACLMLAATVAPAPDTSARLPPSGQAVIARGELVDEDLEDDTPPAPTVETTGVDADDDTAAKQARLQATLDEWVVTNQPALADLGTTQVDASVLDPSGALLSVTWSANGPGAPDDLVPWWSMTKAVTAAWMATLVDRGVVDLDDPLSTYLPDVPRANEVTLEQLARHQSGMPSEPSGLVADGPRVELEQWMDDPRFEFTPGTGFAYSRLGFYLLAWALEEATGVEWVDAVRTFAAQADVPIALDDEVDPLPEPTHPGAGAYRGRLWAAGGVLATRDDTAKFFRWLMTEGLSPAARSMMATFLADESSWYYGLGLLPLCPCEVEDQWLRANRYGLDALTGTWAFDEATTATVFLTSDSWFDDDGPRREFYELESALLDAAV